MQEEGNAAIPGAGKKVAEQWADASDHLPEEDAKGGEPETHSPLHSGMDGEELERPGEQVKSVEPKAIGKGKGRKKIIKDPHQPSLKKFAPTEVQVRIAVNIDDEWHVYIYQASDGPWRLLKLKKPPGSIMARTVFQEVQRIQCVASKISLDDVNISYKIVRNGLIGLWTVQFKPGSEVAHQDGGRWAWTPCSSIADPINLDVAERLVPWAIQGLEQPGLSTKC